MIIFFLCPPTSFNWGRGGVGGWGGGAGGHIYMPPPFSMGGHIVSTLSVRPISPSVSPVCSTIGFHEISFEGLV